MAWLERIFDRMGVIKKYLDTIARAAIVALSAFFDYLAGLCEESPSAFGLATSALNDDFPERVAELSVIAKETGAKA